MLISQEVFDIIKRRFRMKRIVIKVGSALLVDEKAASGLDETFIGRLVFQIGELHSAGHEVILVTSGAVAAGRTDNKNYPVGRAAMVGQIKLISTYCRFFNQLYPPIRVGQALYTYHDLENGDDKRTKERLLDGFKFREITIVNANDAVADEELEAMKELGDNDRLASKMATLIDADLLILLTNVDGLYKNYGQNDQELICEIDSNCEEMLALAIKNDSSLSKGGMESKLRSAIMAREAGVEVIIASGRKSSLLNCVTKDNFVGTVFLPRAD